MWRRTMGAGAIVLLAAALAGACAPAANPAPAFRPAVVLPSAGPGYPESTAAGDVTGDGRTDLVLTLSAPNNPGQGRLVVYPQTSAHTLGAPRALPLLGGYNSGGRLALADLNGDGHLDAVAAVANHLDAYYQRGGMLSAPTHLNIPASDVSTADINGDKRVDLLVVDPNGQSRVYLQSTTHTFAANRAVGPVTALANQGGLIQAADLNGDGRPDLIGSETDGFWSALQTTGGTFAAPIRHYTLADSGNYRWASFGVAAGDVTGDGRADVVQTTSGNADSAVDLFQASTAGVLGAPRKLDTLDSAAGVVIVDLNRDNRADVVVAHADWNAVGVYTQHGDGTLSAEQVFGIRYPAFGPRTVAVGDLNGDGKRDIAVVPGPDSAPGSVLYQR